MLFMERVDLSKVEFTPALRATISAATAQLYQTVPVRTTAERVVLALPPMRLLEAESDDLKTLRVELRTILCREVDFVMADRDQIRQYVQSLYGAAA